MMMKKNQMKWSLVGLFTILASAAFVQAASFSLMEEDTPVVSMDPGSVCIIPKIDGDKVPFPLKGANTRYELAENETYILNGTLVQVDGKVYFRVDFKSQPWLATQKRQQFPLFLVDHHDVSMMKKYGNNLVQMAVVVRKKDVSTNGQEWDSSLVLNVLASPVVVQN
jgi:hypothetical protein